MLAQCYFYTSRCLSRLDRGFLKALDVSADRDIFSTPAPVARIEMLFNSARDICHNRRGRQNSTNIQDLIMFSCLTQFEIEDKQLELARALEVPEEGEDDKISPTTEGIGPTSDTEEGEEEVRQSVRAGKRQKSVLSDFESEQSDDDSVLPLMSQVRHSGRARRRLRHMKGLRLVYSLIFK
jgi:hypothetical protein